MTSLGATLLSFVVNRLYLQPTPFYKPPDAILQMRNIEVYKQTERFATELKVRKNLRLMYRRDGIDRLQFNNHEILDEKIDAIAEVQLHVVMKDRQASLGF